MKYYTYYTYNNITLNLRLYIKTSNDSYKSLLIVF